MNFRTAEGEEEMDSPQTDFQVAHTLWTAAITIAGGIVAFFTKRLFDEVDKKADLADIETLKRDIREFMGRQERQHAATTERLDRIIIEQGRNRWTP